MSSLQAANPWRRRLTVAVAIVWSVGVSVLLAALGRECPVAGVGLDPAESKGWTLRYVVAAPGAEAPTVTQSLLTARRQPDIREIVLAPANGVSGAFAQAGWRVSERPAEAGPWRLEILNPAHELAWKGTLSAEELAVPGARVLDLELLARVIRGQPTPRVVPIGCAPQI